MLQLQTRGKAASPTRLRFTDEWVGLLVIVAVALFIGAAFEAGVLQRWLHPGSRLYILLPQSGTDGLSVGADVDVLGIHAGTVRRIRLNPDGAMTAVADIDLQAEPFIRRDSTATIRRRFAVAGATYIDLKRGTGRPLDWHYAVLQATSEPNPVDTVVKTLAELRQKLVPTLDSTQHLMASLDGLVAGLQQGHGTAGKLLTDDALFNRAQQSLADLQTAIAALHPVETRANGVLRRADATMANLQSASGNVRRASGRLPAISQHVADSTAALPALLTEAQVTADQLRKLIVQLRGSWLLGGGAAKSAPARLPPSDVAP